MEYAKIKKALEKARGEKIKRFAQQLKGVDAIGHESNATTIFYKDKTSIYLHDLTLTDNQRQKTLKEQIQLLYNKQVKKIDREHAKNIEKLEDLAKVQPTNKIEIYVYWTPSRMWGSNPKTTLYTDRRRYEGGSVGGCGYDKRSTATAEVLNASPEIKSELLRLIEKQPQKTINAIFYNNNIEHHKQVENVLGYGMGCYSLPYFSGGCGISCHLQTLEKLGFRVITRHEPNRGSDCYILERKSNKGAKYEK